MFGVQMSLLLFLPIVLSCSLLSGEEALLADAAERKDAHAVHRLLLDGQDVNLPQPDGMTALHWAVLYEDHELAEHLIKSGANPSAANRYLVTPLFLACTNGDAYSVARLLELGASVNDRLRGGESPLMTAARTGKPKPVELLLAAGADVNAVNEAGQTPLMWAAAEGNVAVVDILLKAGADAVQELPSGWSALMFAVREGRVHVVQKLLTAGADVNQIMRPQKGGKGVTPLLLATENGHFELAKMLLQAKADPNAKPAGYAPLHALSWVRKPIRGDGDPPPEGSGSVSSLELVEELVKHGADVQSRLEQGQSGRGRFTTTGSTPFLLASRTGDLPLMKLLMALGADALATNADQSTPFHAACGVGALGDGDEAAATEEEAVQAVEYLLQHGADINAVDKNGETAMHGAAYQSWPKLVKHLHKSGAIVSIWNQKNSWGWTPLMVARGHRPGNFRPHPETALAIEEAMRSAGVDIPPEGKVENDPEY